MPDKNGLLNREEITVLVSEIVALQAPSLTSVCSKTEQEHVEWNAYCHKDAELYFQVVLNPHNFSAIYAEFERQGFNKETLSENKLLIKYILNTYMGKILHELDINNLDNIDIVIEECDEIFEKTSVDIAYQILLKHSKIAYKICWIHHYQNKPFIDPKGTILTKIFHHVKKENPEQTLSLAHEAVFNYFYGTHNFSSFSCAGWFTQWMDMELFKKYADSETISSSFSTPSILLSTIMAQITKAELNDIIRKYEGSFLDRHKSSHSTTIKALKVYLSRIEEAQPICYQAIAYHLDSIPFELDIKNRRNRSTIGARVLRDIDAKFSEKTLELRQNLGEFAPTDYYVPLASGI